MAADKSIVEMTGQLLAKAQASEEEVDRARWLTQVHTDLYDSGRVVAHCVLRWHAQTKGE